MVTVRAHLWYHAHALEAAQFYADLVPGSSVDAVHTAPPGLPGIEEGVPFLVEFTLGGIPVTALAAGPSLTLSDAFSFVLAVDTQEEIDHYWSALTADGGREGPCGWCTDRFGLSWQVIPRDMEQLTMGTDEGSTRAREAMLRMGKLDLPALQAARAGTGASV